MQPDATGFRVKNVIRTSGKTLIHPSPPPPFSFQGGAIYITHSREGCNYIISRVEGLDEVGGGRGEWVGSGCGGGEGLRGGGYPPYLRKLNMPNHGAGAKWICNGRRHRMWDTTEGSCLFSKNNASLSGCQKLVNFDVISSLVKQSRCRGWKEVL